MNTLQHLKRFFASEAGVTSLEYALIAALIAVAIISGVTLLGSNVSTQFSSVAVVI